MPTATFDRFDIVVVPFPFTDVVPFPFTDKAARKRRPALVLSDSEAFNRPAGHSVMAMITSADNPPWPMDTPIADLATSGLCAPSVIRMKLFTLDHRFVLRRVARLSQRDQRSVRKTFSRVFGL